MKGYAQIFGVDFSETSAPVARLDINRLSLVIAAQKCWKVFHLDVKSAFLNGFLNGCRKTRSCKTGWFEARNG